MCVCNLDFHFVLDDFLMLLILECLCQLIEASLSYVEVSIKHGAWHAVRG